MSTSLSGIPNSIPVFENPILSLEAQLKATSYGKVPSPRGIISPSWRHLLPRAPSRSATQWAGLPSALTCDLTCGLVTYN